MIVVFRVGLPVAARQASGTKYVIRMTIKLAPTYRYLFSRRNCLASSLKSCESWFPVISFAFFSSASAIPPLHDFHWCRYDLPNWTGGYIERHINLSIFWLTLFFFSVGFLCPSFISLKVSVDRAAIIVKINSLENFGMLFLTRSLLDIIAAWIAGILCIVSIRPTSPAIPPASTIAMIIWADAFRLIAIFKRFSFVEFTLCTLS